MAATLDHRELLSADDLRRLERHAGEAIRRARRKGECLAAITVTLPATTDPTAAVVALPPRPEPWFVLEQPDRDQAALAALGCVTAIEAQGTDRFLPAAKRWRALASTAFCDIPDGPRGSGPVAVGGFAFADRATAAPHWQRFGRRLPSRPGAGDLRRGDDVRLTLIALAGPDDTAQDIKERLHRRASKYAPRPAPPALGPRARRTPRARRQHDAARALRASGLRAVEQIRAGAYREGRARPRGPSPRRPVRTIPAPSWASCARRFRPAMSSASGAATPPSSPRAPSC